MIQLITCDIDGTLLQDGAIQPQPILFEQIRALKERGVLFCPASGRQYASLRWLFEPVADDIAYMCENGAALYKEGRLLSTRSLRRDYAEAIVRDVRAIPGTELMLSGDNLCYLILRDPAFEGRLAAKTRNNIKVVRDVTEIPEDILKVSVWHSDGSDGVHAQLAPLWDGKVQVAISGAKWMDFTVATKGTGLRDLCADLSIPLENTLAFGDSYNDVPMLEAAGWSYLMRSAVPELLERFPRQCSRPEEILQRLLDEGEAAL